MKIKIDLNKPFLKLNGEAQEQKDASGKVISAPILGRELAAILAAQQKNIKILKAFGWAIALDKNEALELDTPDFDDLQTFIENHEAMFVAFKAQLLNVMSEAKEAATA